MRSSRPPRTYKMVEGSALFLAKIDSHRSSLHEFFGALSEREKRRVERSRGEKRLQNIVSRGLLRHILAEELRVEPRQVALANNREGKPELQGRQKVENGLSFSVSHSLGMIVFAVSSADSIGVDIEVKREKESLSRCIFPDFMDSVGAKVQSAFEGSIQDMVRWTVYEAYMKFCNEKIAFQYRDGAILLGAPVLPPRRHPRQKNLVILEMEEKAICSVILEHPALPVFQVSLEKGRLQKTGPLKIEYRSWKI